MESLTMSPLKPGVVNLPGTTPSSTALVAELLYKDFVAHHCFWNDHHFSNHLSHHILTLHDLGAPAECIEAMYDKEAAMQRPLHPGKIETKSNKITESNWTGSLGGANIVGSSHMYPDYLAFFPSEIAKHGVPGALERYVFSPKANGNGSLMLTRFVGGLLHPIIQAGFGVEFGQDFMVAHKAAVTNPECASVMDLPSGLPEIRAGPPTTLLALLRELYDSDKFAPVPYEKEAIDPQRLRKSMTANSDRGAAIRDLYAKWTFNVGDGTKVEECLWQATLLLGATGKAGRKPRMDFFLMHFLTGSLFLQVVLDALQAPLHKAQLLQAYVRSAVFFLIIRGRPRIDPALVMSYSALPAPSNNEGTSALGKLGSGSPWLAILNNACVHPEPHVIKSIRMFFYCAQRYGSTQAGKIPGALDGSGRETDVGAAKLDGTLFIRVAGVLTDGLGWTAHGDKERFWDLSGIGWEEAWSNKD
ncbi:hypothetical protein C8R44DRAFT_941053 [Mycena epipterygia]|nr:hypothetical protein C8R44DRAFT_941053 [Mycena epipterygia]